MSPFQLSSLVLGSCLQNDKCWFLCQNNLCLRLFLNICGGNYDVFNLLNIRQLVLQRVTWLCGHWPTNIGLVINAPFNVTWCKKFTLPFIFLNPKKCARMVKFPVKFSHCRVYLVFQTGDISVSVCGVCFNQISLSILCHFQSTFNAQLRVFAAHPFSKKVFFLWVWWVVILCPSCCIFFLGAILPHNLWWRFLALCEILPWKENLGIERIDVQSHVYPCQHCSWITWLCSRVGINYVSSFQNVALWDWLLMGNSVNHQHWL